MHLMHLSSLTLLKISDKDKFRVAQEAFQAQCRAESMVRVEVLYSLDMDPNSWHL